MANQTPRPTGPMLVADFQTIFVSAATVQAAEHEATNSENALVEQLESMSNGQFLNPGNLTGNPDDLSRYSLDAHIKKVQVQQLRSMNDDQLAMLVVKAQQTYKGLPVRVTVLPNVTAAIDMIWFDPQHGYRTSSGKQAAISGTIDDVLLDRNALVIRPSWKMRLINRRLQSYVVYIIDPASLTPMVSVDIL